MISIDWHTPKLAPQSQRPSQNYGQVMIVEIDALRIIPGILCSLMRGQCYLARDVRSHQWRPQAPDKNCSKSNKNTDINEFFVLGSRPSIFNQSADERRCEWLHWLVAKHFQSGDRRNLLETCNQYSQIRRLEARKLALTLKLLKRPLSSRGRHATWRLVRRGPAATAQRSLLEKQSSRIAGHMLFAALMTIAHHVNSAVTGTTLGTGFSAPDYS